MFEKIFEESEVEYLIEILVIYRVYEKELSSEESSPLSGTKDI